MRRASLQQYVKRIDERKLAVGLTDELVESLRNRGERRTSEKRETLFRIQERARQAGIQPLLAYF